MVRALALLAFAAGAAAADLAVGASPRAVLGQQPAAGGGAGGGALAATLGSGSIAAVAPDAAADAAAVVVAAVDASGHATATPRAATVPETAHALLDHLGKPLTGALGDRCQQAVSEVLARDAAGEAPPVHASALDGLSVAPRNETHDVRIAYFIGIGGRPSAMQIVQRLLYALYSPVHAFLLHVDVKAADEVAQGALQLERAYANVACLRTRRLVQWGMWSMVAIMLDAIESLLQHALEFDFFINLSDADVSLRTDAEVRAFFSRMKGRSMINVHEGGGEVLLEANKFIDAHTIVECGGYGFVVLNKSHADFPLTAGCCIGRSGPAAFATLPLNRHPVLEESAVQTGSQWVSLHYDFCHFLLRDPHAQRILAAFERRLVPDEAVLQTVVMASPFKHSLLNHNMRWIYWPHQDGNAQEYWDRVGGGGRDFVGGPKVLNASELAPVFASPYLFARKVDPAIDKYVLLHWDQWMARKLAGETLTPVQAPIGHSPGDPELSIRFKAPGLADVDGERRLHLASKRRRRLARIEFEDGSSCVCGCGQSAALTDCCDGRFAEACATSTDPPVDLLGEPLGACPEPSSAQSVPNGESIVVTWLNQATHPVRLSVLDYEGIERDMQIINPAPDNTLAFNSAEGIMWRARALNGELLVQAAPTAAEAQVVVSGCRFRYEGAIAALMMDAKAAAEAEAEAAAESTR